MNAADASVAVAAFARWHPSHDRARAALGDDATIVAHAAFETYSVLTRLPASSRATPGHAREFLMRRFPDEYLTLAEPVQRATLRRFPELGIAGGAVYDALIAATGREHGATLLTLDRRAIVTYERIGASYELVDGSG